MEGDESKMMQTIRQRILNTVHQNDQVTVTDLAAALSMAPVSVRYHLDVLQNDGLIVIAGVKRKQQAGRPEQVYALTPEALDRFPNNYRMLAAGLLTELRHRLPDSGSNDLARIVAERLAAQAHLPVSFASFPDRLKTVVDYLNSLSYSAHWRQVDDVHYLLQTDNCPYAALLADFPELCQMDKLLVEKLVGRPAQVDCRQCGGKSYCRYTFNLSQ